MKLFDSTFGALERALDLRFKRHVVLSSNVANSETPNYRAREVNFAGELKRVLDTGKTQDLKTTHTKHLETGLRETSHIVLDKSMPIGADGNSVDLDIAMGKLSANSRAYTGAATLITMKLRTIRTAARGRGGI